MKDADISGLFLTERDQFSDIHVATPKENERASIQLREELSSVSRMLIEGGIWDTVLEEIALDSEGNLLPIGGERRPVERLQALQNGVATIVREAAGHDFDVILYPWSGSDISTALAYGAQWTVSIDENDLFGVYDATEDERKERIRRSFKEKLTKGWHQHNINEGVVAYTEELLLAGIDIESVTVVAEASQQTFPESRLRILTFQTNEGKQRYHVCVDRLYLEEHLREDDQMHTLLAKMLEKIFHSNRTPLILRKAGGSESDTTRFLYDVAPVGTTVVADVNEREIQTGIVKFDNLKTRREADALAALEVGKEGADPLKVISRSLRLQYGYLKYLVNLEILKVT